MEIFQSMKKKKNYYKPVRVTTFRSNNCIEHQSKGDRNKTLSAEEYLNKIRLYLKEIINNLKKSDTWKIQLTIAIKFISSKENDEECVIHSKSDNVEIMINYETDKVKLFKSLKDRYQNNLELMTGSEFVFDYVHLFYYKCHKINPIRAGSYIDYPD